MSDSEYSSDNEYLSDDDQNNEVSENSGSGDDDELSVPSSIPDLSDTDDDTDNSDDVVYYEDEEEEEEEEEDQPTVIKPPSQSIQTINANKPMIKINPPIKVTTPTIAVKPPAVMVKPPTVMVKPPTVVPAPQPQVVAQQIQHPKPNIEQMSIDQLMIQQPTESDDMYNYRRRYAGWIKRFYPNLADHDIQVLAYKAGQNAFLNVVYDNQTMANINTVNQAIKQYSST